jgi:hypothetical protein
MTSIDRSAHPHACEQSIDSASRLGCGRFRMARQQRTLSCGLWSCPGYRQIDTAQVYDNETSVGRVLAECGVPRDEVFVRIRFNPSRKDPAAEPQRSLKLRTEHRSHRQRVAAHDAAMSPMVFGSSGSLAEREQRMPRPRGRTPPPSETPRCSLSPAGHKEVSPRTPSYVASS